MPKFLAIYIQKLVCIAVIWTHSPSSLIDLMFNFSRASVTVLSMSDTPPHSVSGSVHEQCCICQYINDGPMRVQKHDITPVSAVKHIVYGTTFFVLP